MIVIVPNHVETAINAEIDSFLAIKPEFENLREEMYNDLLTAYNATGAIAELIDNTEADNA
jgi:hypothetical protein